MNPKAMGNSIVRIADAFGLEKLLRRPRDESDRRGPM
jgi:hypothetical protein